MATEAAGADDRPALAGWFGKIPALGDFVARRLPPHFIEAWDHWLSTEIWTTREALGSEWSESYRNAPTWCFALMPGALDASNWYGVLAPSVDRVGRHFPLTLVARSEQPSGETYAVGWSTMIAAANRSRAPDCDAEALDAVLVGTLEPDSAGALPAGGEPAVRAALESAGSGRTVWAPWRRGAGRFGSVLTFEGLPQGPDFLKLIVG
jgi:type VI secretion system protein ImpM